MRLFYYHDLSLDEVADRLDLSVPAVKSRLHAGRRQLRRRLAADWPQRDRVACNGSRRGASMIEVRIARVLPVASRLLVALVDTSQRRVLPLWLHAREARALRSSTEFADGLLRATGARIRAVHVAQLHDNLFVAEVLLDTPAGERAVRARLGDGLALAHQHGVRILVDDALFVLLGRDAAEAAVEQDVLERVVEVAVAKADLAGRAEVTHAHHGDRHADRATAPQNPRFSDGLDHWDLRGSFLHDMSGNHWQDYTCGTDEAGGYVKAQVPEPIGFANLSQGILADAFRGGRVRLRCDVKSADVTAQAGAFLRVVGADHVSGREDRRQTLLHGTHDWTAANLETDVPNDSVFILYGITITGPGQIWLTNLELERVR